MEDKGEFDKLLDYKIERKCFELLAENFRYIVSKN